MQWYLTKTLILIINHKAGVCVCVCLVTSMFYLCPLNIFFSLLVIRIMSYCGVLVGYLYLMYMLAVLVVCVPEVLCHGPEEVRQARCSSGN